MDKKIGLFDSGIGGLSILKELLKILPNENYYYYQDSLHNPYGSKSEKEILKLAQEAVEILLKEHCKIIVIACNTATTACMKKLREIYPNVIFVGTVPAIKVSYDNDSKNTILLSTPYTTKSKRVQELLHLHTDDFHKIINVSGENLAHLIDINLKDEIHELLEKILSPYKGKVDSLIMGCTHYSLIKREILEVLPGIHLYDGSVGVSKEVYHQLEIHHLLNHSNMNGTIEIINNKSNDYVKRSFEILNSTSIL